MSTTAKEERIVRVGTRNSQLAMIQTNNVIQMLKAKDPTLKFETLSMTTTGDRILDSHLSKIGEKSLFTKELENALLNDQVDFVVHSLKDLPTVLPEKLVIGCVCKRDNPNDAVVMHPRHMGKTLKDLPDGSVIGTSSLRRSAQMQRIYPQFKIENIRGNLNTRFRKLAEQNLYDGIILAAAGLDRMGWSQCIAQELTPEECMYAVSQGAMAVECREGDEKILNLLRMIHDHTTTVSCIAERAYLKQLEGGCSVPVSVYSEIKDQQLLLKGGVFSVDGQQSVEYQVTADLNHPTVPIPAEESFVGIHCQTQPKKNEYTSAWNAGVELARGMIGQGAEAILIEAKAIAKKGIIAEHEKRQLIKQMEKESASPSATPPSSAAASTIGAMAQMSS